MSFFKQEAYQLDRQFTAEVRDDKLVLEFEVEEITAQQSDILWEFIDSLNLSPTHSEVLHKKVLQQAEEMQTLEIITQHKV